MRKAAAQAYLPTQAEWTHVSKTHVLIAKIVERQQMHIRPFVQAQGDGEIHQRAATGSPGRGASSGRQG